jgi:hypothetical protein
LFTNDWKWKDPKWIYAYIIFFIYNGLVLITFINHGTGSAGGAVLLFILIFAFWCSKKDFDINRKVSSKIFRFFGIFVGQSVFSALLTIPIMTYGISYGILPSVTDQDSYQTLITSSVLSHTIIGIATLYLVMSRSTTFVDRKF